MLSWPTRYSRLCCLSGTRYKGHRPLLGILVTIRNSVSSGSLHNAVRSFTALCCALELSVGVACLCCCMVVCRLVVFYVGVVRCFGVVCGVVLSCSVFGVGLTWRVIQAQYAANRIPT